MADAEINGSGNGQFATFSPDGTLLGNLTSSQGSIPAPTFALPGSTLTDAGLTPPSASNGIAPSSVTPAATSTGTPSTPTAAATSSWLNISLGQVAIVILGLVFVAVGLLMFEHGTNSVTKVAPGLLHPRA